LNLGLLVRSQILNNLKYIHPFLISLQGRS